MSTLKSSDFDTVGGKKLAQIKFVVIGPYFLRATFDHVVTYLIPLAYNMLVISISPTFIANLVFSVSLPSYKKLLLLMDYSNCFRSIGQL